MKNITLTEQQMESLDWLIDYLQERESIVMEEVERYYGEPAIFPIDDLVDIFNNSLD